MKNFKFKIGGLFYLLLIGIVLFSFPVSARLIRGNEIQDPLGGARLIIYTEDGTELGRFNEGGWEINPPEEKKRLNEDLLDAYLNEYGPLLIRTRLDKQGNLQIAGLRAAGNGSGEENPYANKLVEVKLVKSLKKGGAVTDLWFLNKQGEREEYATDKEGNIIIDKRTNEKILGHQEFKLIYTFSETAPDNRGLLVASYHARVNPFTIDNYLSQFGHLLIRTRLNNKGQLNIAGWRAAFGDGSGEKNYYANKQVEVKLVKSLEKGGSVKEVWILNEKGERIEEKKFIWIEDFDGNIITSFYKFPIKKLDLKNVHVYVPEHKRGIIKLPDKAIKLYGTNDSELIRIKRGEGGEILEVLRQKDGRWEEVRYKEIEDKWISYRVNEGRELAIKDNKFNLIAEFSIDGLKGGDTEKKAIKLVMRYEEERGMEVISIENPLEYEVSCDLLSQTPNGIKPFEERYIEVKGRKGEKGTIDLTFHQIAEAESEPENYYLYIVIFLNHKALLYIIPNPAEELKSILEENGE
jgi:hypothetical protein